jgi:Tol biopolymer transport system component
VDLVRGVRIPFTRNERDEPAAVWWPDGSRIVFSGGRGASGMDLYVKAASGAGAEEVLLQDPLNKMPLSVSRKEDFLIYATPPPDANLWVLPLNGDRKPIPYMQTPFNENGGRFSPDGRCVAFGSNESGGPEMYIAPFPATGAKDVVSSTGAAALSARWRDDGSELFYLSPDGTLMAAAVDRRGGECRVSGLKALFPLPVGLSGGPVSAASGLRRLCRRAAVSG